MMLRRIKRKMNRAMKYALLTSTAIVAFQAGKYTIKKKVKKQTIKVKEKHITLRYESGSCQAVITNPVNHKFFQQVPAVVLLPDFGENRNGIADTQKELAAALAQAGIMSLRIDLYQRDALLSVAQSMQKGTAAIQYLRKLPKVHKKKIGIHGIGYGARIAALVQEQQDIKAMCLWNCDCDNALSLQKDTCKQSDDMLILSGVMNQRVQTIKDFYQAYETMQPIYAMQNYEGALLMIHGEENKITPIEACAKFLETFHGEDGSLELIKGGNRCFIDANNVTSRKKAMDHTIAFFKQHLL